MPDVNCVSEIHAKYIIIVRDTLRDVGIAIGLHTEDDYEKAMKRYEEDQSGDYEFIVGYET